MYKTFKRYFLLTFLFIFVNFSMPASGIFDNITSQAFAAQLSQKMFLQKSMKK